jgi:hypothetical protein
MMSSAMGQVLVTIGLVITAIGIVIWLGVPLGRLPGDLTIRRDGFTVYLPITTSIVVSLVLTVVGMLLRK